MSWNISMEVDVGGGNMRGIDVIDLNYTFNVSPMYYDAIGEIGMRGLSGMGGDEAYPILVDAIKKMKDSPDKYKEMNPPNGWGNYEGALNVLEEMAKAALECPKAVFCIH